MGMTLYSCITPIAQMSRKHWYLLDKANDLLTAVYCQSRLPLGSVSLTSNCCLFQHHMTTNFYATVSYKLNACTVEFA